MAKNKLARAGGLASLTILHGRGLDRAGELVTLGLELGIIERHGAGLVWGQVPLGWNSARARLELEADPELAERKAGAIRRLVRTGEPPGGGIG